CVNQTVHEIGQAFVAPVCRIPLLGSGESRTFTIQLAIPPDYRPQTTGALAITSSALIVVSETHEDPTPLDSRSVVTSTIAPQADVAVTNPGLRGVIAGAIASYSIDVTNRGPSSATNVVVSDPFPAGLTLVDGSGPCAAGFPCTIPLLEAGEDSTTRIDLL